MDDDPKKANAIRLWAMVLGRFRVVGGPGQYPPDCPSAQNLAKLKSKRVEMGGGGGSKKILVGFVVLMFLGSVVYFRLWTIDYKVSSDETELIRFAMLPIFSLSTSQFLFSRVYVSVDSLNEWMPFINKQI